LKNEKLKEKTGSALVAPKSEGERGSCEHFEEGKVDRRRGE